MWIVPQLGKTQVPPAPRGGHALAAIGTKVLVFGGCDRSPTLLDDLWVLDTGGGKYAWTQVIPMSPKGQRLTGRSGATFTAMGHLVYMFGGQDPASNACSNELIQLDITASRWSIVEVSGERPQGRHSHCSGRMQANSLVVFGGAAEDGQPMDDVWVFSFKGHGSGTWQRVWTQGEAPAAREMHSGTMLSDSRLLVYGGRGRDGKVLNDAAVLDVQAGTWIKRQGTLFHRCAHSAVLMPTAPTPAAVRLSNGYAQQGKAVYVYGGFSGEAVEGNLITIDPETLRAPEICKAPETSEPLAQDMLVFGGVNSTADLNDLAVWRAQ